MEKKESTSMVTLTPSEGKYLYNGKAVAKVVHAPLSADISQWQEISQEEGDGILQERAKARKEAQEKHKAEAEAKRAEHKAEAEAKRAEHKAEA